MSPFIESILQVSLIWGITAPEFPFNMATEQEDFPLKWSPVPLWHDGFKKKKKKGKRQ
jgi:hypothetical protein